MYALIGLSLVGTVYLATFSTTTVVIFPAILLLVGYYGERIVARRKARPEEDIKTTSSEYRGILYYTVIAVAGMFIAGFAVNFLNFGDLALTSFDSLIYSLIIAVAETMFFQGFILAFLLSSNIRFLRGNPYLAIIAGAGICVAYHLARYGANPNALLYVFFGFTILNWVAYKSRRLSPVAGGHLINNALASSGFQIAQVAAKTLGVA
jgi:membrane protease YdiL (CAAX protease family)